MTATTSRGSPIGAKPTNEATYFLTGTAYKIEGGVYVRKYVASFVGLAPIGDPRLVVAVMIDEPTGGAHYGGDVAGPVFSQIMGGSLRTLGIPPDDPLQVADAAARKGRL